jgi:hypothetical protein
MINLMSGQRLPVDHGGTSLHITDSLVVVPDAIVHPVWAEWKHPPLHDE